jgi:putative tryptophan/tyrosine transport system substrate-binding protein
MMVRPSGLMSCGPNYPDLFGRAADYVNRILRGEQPAEMPVVLPTKFDMVITSKPRNR